MIMKRSGLFSLLTGTYWLGFLSLAIPLSANAADPPDHDELVRQAARCRQLLKSSVIDFYLPLVDTANMVT